MPFLAEKSHVSQNRGSQGLFVFPGKLAWVKQNRRCYQPCPLECRMGPLKTSVHCMRACMLSHLSHVQLFATLWTRACQAPCPWDSPGNTGVGCHNFLPGDLLNTGIKPILLCLLHWQAGSLPLEPPGKHFQPLCTVVPAAQSCPTLCDPTDYRPTGSSVHGILQARILEWVTISFSTGSPQPRDQTQGFCIAGRFFIIWATGKSNH